MTDPRVNIYKPYEGRTVRIWLSFRPEVTVTGKMSVVETQEGSAQPFAGFVVETEKGPQTISFGSVRRFELVDTVKVDRRKGKRSSEEL